VPWRERGLLDPGKFAVPFPVVREGSSADLVIDNDS
jgi:hypothetical protein